MELFDPQFFYPILLFAVTAVLLLQRGFHKTSQRLPPGPWRLPVIGSLHHLIASGEPLHHRLRDLARDHGPLMYLQLGQIPTVIVSSPDAAREIMKTHDINFASRPANLSARIFFYGCRDIAAAPYGEYWRTVKKVCVLDLLSVKRVRSYRHIREEEVSTLVETISSSSDAIPINMSAKFKALSNTVTARAAVGSKNNHQDVMLECMEEILKVALGTGLVDLFPSCESLLLWLTGTKRVFDKVFQKMDAILDLLISEHRAKFTVRTQEGGNVVSVEDGEGEEDLLDVLINHYERQDLGFELSINDLKAIFQDIFIGGTDTSASTMEWAFSELIRNPKAMDKAQKEARQVFQKHGKLDDTVRDELHYVKLVISETLRLHPPIPLLAPRECRNTTTIGSYEIQKGCRLLVNVWALGRDPNHWDNPEEFNPERFLLDNTSTDSAPNNNFLGTDFRLLPFGAGRRMCPGYNFALPLVELALARLLCQFDWKLAEGKKCMDLNMEEKFGATASKKFPLYLVATNHFA